MLTMLLLACGRPTTSLSATGEGRLHHEQSGPDWATQNQTIADTVHVDGGAHGAIAAVAGSTLQLQLDPPQEASAQLLPRGAGEARTISFQAGQAQLELEERVGVWDLVVELPGEPISVPVVTTWDQPIPDTPLYERMLVWTATWVDGLPSRAVTPADQIEAAEDRIALATLRGIEELGRTEGRSYGPFPRPKEKDNQAHVWLDHPRSACGEYRGGFMAMVEQHGVDATWVMMSFKDHSPERLSMYETREIAAVGTEPKVWQHFNHVAVEVNGQLYDPTYALHHPDWQSYEDDLFERYCYGEDSKCKTPGGWCQQPRPEGSCVPNPPGYDPDDPTMGMKVWRGENY